jgi:uroporphyrinogen-III decarboxylase
VRDQMSSRERWYAALRCEPADRIPFWPKLDLAYPNHQKGRFKNAANDELHEFIGSDIHDGGPDCISTRRTNTSVDVVSRPDGSQVTTYTTPRRTLTYIEGFDVDSHSYHPIRHPVQDVEDIEALTEFFADAEPEFDPEAAKKARAILETLGDSGIVATGIGISPLMDWLQHIAGVENGHYLLHDEPDRVEALFAEIHRYLLRKAEIIAEQHPFDIVYSVENTSTTLISPAMFDKYCMPLLTDYGRLLSDANKIHVLHMCGTLKRLLPQIGALPSHVNEAFTSAPVGDTSLMDGRSEMPDRCLIGGTNAALWLEPGDNIIRTIERDLAELPHHRGVVISSGGVMPPRCTPETIRRVRDWVVTQQAA